MHIGSLQDTCRMEQGCNIKPSDATCRMALVQEKLAQQAQRTPPPKKKASHASKKNGQGGITDTWPATPSRFQKSLKKSAADCMVYWKPQAFLLGVV